MTDPRGAGAYVDPPEDTSLVQTLLDLQSGPQAGWDVFDHFNAFSPDGNKSNAGYQEFVTGGGLSDVASTVSPPISMGNALLQLPARVAPVAPDAATLLLLRSATQLIDPNEMLGEVGQIFRVALTNPPQAGSDYVFHFGVTDPIANNAESADGFYIFADATSANWFVKHRRAGAEVVSDLGLAMTGGSVFQTLMVVANVTTGLVRAWGADDGDVLTERTEVEPVDIQPALAVTSNLTIQNPGNITLEAGCSIDYVGYYGRPGVPQ